MKTATKKAAPKPAYELEALTPTEVVGLMLWKNRHANPNLAVVIDENDVAGLKACLKYLKVEPQVTILHRKNSVIVAMIEAGSINPDEKSPTYNPTGNAITPIENNEADYNKALAGKEMKRIREQAPMLAAQLRNDMAQHVLSDSTINEAADALVALSKL